jgi:exosortase
MNGARYVTSIFSVKDKPWRTVAPIVIIGLYWLLLLWHLAGHWNTNPQYAFGWLVPFLCAHLLFLRWTRRPEPASPQHRRVVVFFVISAAFVWLPAWVLEQPNPDWRLVSWTLGGATAILSLGVVYLIGGKPWLLHFAFPISFVLTSVPWPFGIEWPVIQSLTRVVVAITVELLNAFGFAAIRHGSIIETSNGLLGVDEACSGIRSLQAVVMGALFLGELYRFGWMRRGWLVLTGMALAVGFNIGRAFLLAWIAVHDGVDATSKWHDPAGFSILTLCFLGVWALAARSFTPRVEPRIIRKSAPHPFPNALSWSLGIWFLVVLTGTELWYRQHEAREKLTWSFVWPQSRAHFTEQPLSRTVLETLQYDEGRSATWTGTDGTARAAVFLKWAAGTSRSRIPARSHRPEICLTASGFNLVSDLGMINAQAGELTIPFEEYVFEKDGQPVHVFFCVWQDRPKDAAGRTLQGKWNRFAGLEFAMLGERRISQQVLEFAIFGPTDTAEAVFRRELQQLVRL